MIEEVTVYLGRNGVVLTRTKDGRISFPDQRINQPEPKDGEVWRVEITGQNPRKTVNFLRLIERIYPDESEEVYPDEPIDELSEEIEEMFQEESTWDLQVYEYLLRQKRSYRKYLENRQAGGWVSCGPGSWRKKSLIGFEDSYNDEEGLH